MQPHQQLHVQMYPIYLNKGRKRHKKETYIDRKKVLSWSEHNQANTIAVLGFHFGVQNAQKLSKDLRYAKVNA